MSEMTNIKTLCKKNLIRDKFFIFTYMQYSIFSGNVAEITYNFIFLEITEMSWPCVCFCLNIKSCWPEIFKRFLQPTVHIYVEIDKTKD